jgi:hypothetical protein
MKAIEMTAEAVNKALEASKATSLTGLYRALGGSGSIPGSTAKRMRELVGDLEERLAKNKAVGSPATKPTAKKEPKAAKPKASRVPRHPQNPFREGSNYGTLVDLIAQAGQTGVSKDSLIKSYCRATGKEERLAKYDLSVIVSASQDAEKRHRSCRDGFQVIRVGDNLSVTFG